MPVIRFVLLILSLLVFFMAALDVKAPRVNLVALGLALSMLAVVLGASL